jgi:hypothetical protein
MLQIGTALQSLHAACKYFVKSKVMVTYLHLTFRSIAIIHGDLKMENVVRLGQESCFDRFRRSAKVQFEKLRRRKWVVVLRNSVQEFYLRR